MTMAEFRKEFDIIEKSYNEKLLDCHRQAFETATMPVAYIANYIKFLRDYYLLTLPDDASQKDTELAGALVAAANAYDKYVVAKEKIAAAENAEALKKLEEEKNAYWESFIQLLAFSMGGKN